MNRADLEVSFKQIHTSLLKIVVFLLWRIDICFNHLHTEPHILRYFRNITNLYSGSRWEIGNILQCSLRSVHDITNLHLTNNRELTHVLRKSEQFLLNWLHPLCYSSGYRFRLFLRFSVWFWTCTDIVLIFIISKRVLSFCRNFTNQYIPLV